MSFSTSMRVTLEGLWVKPIFTDLDDCFQQGESAGSDGYKREENPYPSGIPQREWWDAGWSQSYDELCGDGNGDLG